MKKQSFGAVFLLYKVRGENMQERDSLQNLKKTNALVNVQGVNDLSTACSSSAALIRGAFLGLSKSSIQPEKSDQKPQSRTYTYRYAKTRENGSSTSTSVSRERTAITRRKMWFLSHFV